MSTRTKQIFLFLTIVVPFLGYCIIYYTPILKNAPFRSDEFVSFQFQWGAGNDMPNIYDSSTGRYEYLDRNDSLIKTNVKLRPNDISYLHHKMNELGYWNFPDLIANTDTDLNKSKVLRYVFTFNYKRKTKKVIYLTDYSDIPKLATVAGQMKVLVEKTIGDAEERYSKK